MGQVGEDADVVGDSADALQGQAVGSRLDDRGRVPGHNHGPQSLLQQRGLGRGDVLRVGAAQGADLELSRRQQTRRDSRRLQDRRRQERGCRLAVRAGDAHDPHLEAWVAVPPGRGHGQGAPAAVDDRAAGRPLHRRPAPRSRPRPPERLRRARDRGRRRARPARRRIPRPRRTRRESSVRPPTSAPDGGARRKVNSTQPALGLQAGDQLAQWFALARSRPQPGLPSGRPRPRRRVTPLPPRPGSPAVRRLPPAGRRGHAGCRGADARRGPARPGPCRT